MAHLHTARILWESNSDDFTKNQYSRAHHWSFDGGQTVLASSSPTVVRVPFSDPAGDRSGRGTGGVNLRAATC